MSCIKVSEQKLLVQANAENGFKKKERKKEKRKRDTGYGIRRAAVAMVCFV